MPTERDHSPAFELHVRAAASRAARLRGQRMMGARRQQRALHEAVDACARRHPERVALRERDRELTYQQLDDWAAGIAGRLASAGVGRASHNPRVVIDRLVVARERWTLRAGDIEALAEARSVRERFLAARRLAEESGMPRLVFLGRPGAKPMLVDLRSPVSIEVAAGDLRRATETADPSVTLTEMLPLPDELWLEDAAGRHYTSELRMVVHYDDAARSADPRVAGN